MDDQGDSEETIEDGGGRARDDCSAGRERDERGREKTLERPVVGTV